MSIGRATKGIISGGQTIKEYVESLIDIEVDNNPLTIEVDNLNNITIDIIDDVISFNIEPDDDIDISLTEIQNIEVEVD